MRAGFIEIRMAKAREFVQARPRDGPKKKNSTQRSRSSPRLNRGRRRSQRRKNHQTKKSRIKRRKPMKRRMGPALMRLRGRRLRERTKEVGMALKRDSSRMQ